MLHLPGDLASTVAQFTDLISSIAPLGPAPSPTPAPSSASAPSDVGWFEKFFTGPPMAGLFAIGAAGIAYKGILKQVAKTSEANRLSEEANEHTRAANDETVRKNGEDQWWSTLKWAYQEAKTYKDSSDSTESLALVDILQNLGAVEGISEFQNSTANNVIALFMQSTDPLVRESAEKASATVSQAASGQDQDPGQYVEALHAALMDLVASVGATLYGDGKAGAREVDWIIETSDQKLIAIEWKYRHNRRIPTGMSQVTAAFGVVGGAARTGAWLENTNPLSGVLLVANTPISNDAEPWVQRHHNEISFVQWEPGDSYEPLAAALKGLLSS